MSFKKGDRVVYTGESKAYAEGGDRIGQRGTVTTDYGRTVDVKWDEQNMYKRPATNVFADNLAHANPVVPQADSHDPVNNPKHYTSHPSGVECITITQHMGFNLGNAFKYIWRADLKNNAIEDLRKAQFYIATEIAKREKAAK